MSLLAHLQLHADPVRPLGAVTMLATAALLAFSGAPRTAVVNHPPNPPVITEPATDGLTLNPADVHMEQAPFSDPDPGDQHYCTDWEIWTVTPSERIWLAACETGL